MMTREAGQDELLPLWRLLLISESEGLAGLLKHLLGPTHGLTRISTLQDALDRGDLDDADAVVFDLPRDGSDTDIVRLRHRFRGRLVVLVQPGHNSRGLPADWSWMLLPRPFSVGDLEAALGLPGRERTRPAVTATRAARHEGPALVPAPAAPAPAATPGPPAPAPDPASAAAVKAAARRAPSYAEHAARWARQGPVGQRMAHLLAMLTQGWKARRRNRVAGFSALAAVTFTIAFVLAAQGRCGPGCDALGTAVAPVPTIAPSESSAPPSTAARRAPSTTGPKGVAPATGAFEGTASGGLLAPATTVARATTTTRRPAGGPATSPPTSPPTTAPTTTPPTTAPPTTAPPTTAPPTTAPPTTAGP
jgi:hypothetical protein